MADVTVGRVLYFLRRELLPYSPRLLLSASGEILLCFLCRLLDFLDFLCLGDRDRERDLERVLEWDREGDLDLEGASDQEWPREREREMRCSSHASYSAEGDRR